jgi:hypothetical protein
VGDAPPLNVAGGTGSPSPPLATAKGTAMTGSALGRAAATLLAMQIGLAWAGGTSGAEPAIGETRAAATRTVKERLSSKARDEQRVDNCKVPPELRGPKPRPDCASAPSAPPTH